MMDREGGLRYRLVSRVDDAAASVWCRLAAEYICNKREMDVYMSIYHTYRILSQPFPLPTTFSMHVVGNLFPLLDNSDTNTSISFVT